MNTWLSSQKCVGQEEVVSDTEVIMNIELPGAKAGKFNSSIFRMDYFK